MLEFISLRVFLFSGLCPMLCRPSGIVKVCPEYFFREIKRTGRANQPFLVSWSVICLAAMLSIGVTWGREGDKDSVLEQLMKIRRQIFNTLFFRMRAKTSEFLKVLNRAKIEEETKKKPSYMGAKTPFI